MDTTEQVAMGPGRGTPLPPAEELQTALATAASLSWRP